MTDIAGRPLTVLADATDPVAAGRLRAVLASLPGHWRPVARAPADVVVVSGADWTHRVTAGLGGETRAVVVTRPGAASPDAVRRLAAAAGASDTAVVVDRGAVHHATWGACVGAWRDAFAGATLLDTLQILDAHAAGSADARRGLLSIGLLEQLALVRSVTGSAGEIVAGGADEATYRVTARAEGVPLAIAGTLSSTRADELRIDLDADQRHHRARFDRAAHASPARLVSTNLTAARVEPDVYESAARGFWTALATNLEGGTVPTEGLAALAGDIDVVDQLGL